MTIVSPSQSFVVAEDETERRPLRLALPNASRDFASVRHALRITRLAHAAVLIQWGDEALLTDPWFSEKPLYHPGERFALGPEALPKLTGVVSSMNHYDHFDVAAFASYRDRDAPFLVIAGSGQREAAERAGFRDVRPLAAGTSMQVGSFEIHAIRANPAAAPADFEYEQAYVIEIGGHVALFCPHFLKGPALAEVARRFPRVDLALLGINGLRIKPKLWRQLSMDPADAARVCAKLDARVAVPIHYAFDGGWLSRTFLLQHKGTPQQFSEAARWISPVTTVVTLAPGQPLDIVETEPACRPD